MPPNALRRRHLLLSTLAACASAALPAAHAQEPWPAKPVRIVVPFAPGGTTDILARAMAPELSRAFGQPFIVDNRAGAGGNVGADAVAKSAPDGYTLLMGTVGTHGINRALYAKLPFDPIRDFAPITLVAAVPNVMVMNTEKARTLGIHNVQDFIRVKEPVQDLFMGYVAPQRLWLQGANRSRAGGPARICNAADAAFAGQPEGHGSKTTTLVVAHLAHTCVWAAACA